MLNITLQGFKFRVYTNNKNTERKMASITRSAIISTAKRRITTSSSKSSILKSLLTPKSVPVSPFHSSSRPLTRSASRVVGALGSVESMLPMHSVIASSRLMSNLALDSTCWSFLSQGLASSL